MRRNPSGKQEINELANEISKNNIDNIAENTANINSYRKNFITKNPTIFNVDSILTAPNPKGVKEFDKNDNEEKINPQIQINNNSNFILHKDQKNEIAENKSVSDHTEDVEGENMDIGSSEIHGLSAQPLENIFIPVKTKRSCMEKVQNALGDGIGALKAHDINSKGSESKKSSEYERNDSVRNNVSGNATKIYDQKIDDMQSQLLELQKDVNKFFISIMIKL